MSRIHKYIGSRAPIMLPGRLAIVFLATLFICSSANSQSCTTSWATATDGDWSVDGNWTAGAPDANDTACIAQSGTYTVTLDRAQALDRLEIGGSSGTQTLVMGGAFTTLGSGLIRANARVENVSSDPCGTCDGFPDITETLTIEGTLTHTTGVGLATTSGTVDIAPGGELLIDTGSGSVSVGVAGGSLFRIRGRLAFDPGSGTIRNTTLKGGIEIDGGTVAVLGAVAIVESQGTLNNATFDVSAGAELNFQDGVNASGSYVATGTMGGDVQGLLRFRGGELSAGPGGATLAVSGNGLLADILSSLDPFEFSSAGGTFTNVGLLRIATHLIAMRNVLLINAGTVMIDEAGRLQLLDGAGFENQATGLLDLVDAGQLIGGPAGGTFENSGTVTVRLVDRAFGTAVIGVPILLDGGTVNVDATRLDFQSEGVVRNATFNVTAGGEANFASGSGNSGVYVVEGTLSGNAEGALRFTGVDAQAGAGNATLSVEGTGIHFKGVTGRRVVLSSSGGEFVNTRLATFDLLSEVRSVVLRNESKLDIDNVLVYLEDGGQIRNAIGGTVDLIGNAGTRVEGTSPGTFVNEGLIIKSGAGTSTFGNLLRGQAGSEMRVGVGRYSLLSEDPANYGAGVRLTGGGDNGDVYNLPPARMQGTISPGTDDDPIATMRFGYAYGMSLDLGDARLVIDVDADGASDVVHVQNGAAIGGTLVVRVQEGYTPKIGDAFTILFESFNNIIGGSFGAVEVEGAPEGVSFVIDTSNRGAVILRVVASVAVYASNSETTEGSPSAFVLTHPALSEPFSINVEADGSATPFADYTLGMMRGVIRARPNTTQTVVQLFARRDVDAAEGTETVTLRVLPGNEVGPVEGQSEATISILDGPSSDVLALESIVPARGGNLGTVTPTILGSGLGEDAVVHLAGAATVESSFLEATENGAGVSAVFDLQGVPTGLYDVVVERGGETETLPNAFEVFAADSVAHIWADIAGTTSPRNGRWSTYTVFLGNDTDADVYDVGLILRITNGAEFEFLEGILDLDDATVAEQQLVMPGLDGAQVVPLWFKKLPARSTGSFRVRVRPVAPLTFGDGLGVAYELYPPDNANPFTWSGDFDESVPFNYGLIFGSLGVYLDLYPPDGGSTNPAGKSTSWPPHLTYVQDPSDCPPPSGGDPPPLMKDLSPEDLLRGYGAGNRFNKYHGGNVSNSTSTAVSEYSGFGLGQLLVNATKTAIGFTLGTVTGGLSTMWALRSYGNKAASVIDDRKNDDSWFGPTNNGPGTGGACGEVGGPHDPNEKYGPAGAGGERFYDPSSVSTPYTIAFENIETASFPAQEVLVVDTLDTSVFDLSTFSLGPIRWGLNHVITPPPGAKNFETEIDLSPEIQARLIVTASLDLNTGRAVWYFATIDPETGDLPEDGTIGFLPPNVTSPDGEGSVTFTVRARDNLSTGTTVANGAEIVFDVNEPILTPVWSNTVDLSPPSSSVQSLAASGTNPVEITIDATDNGSGVQLYGLYASKDGGAFELVQTSLEPAFIFEGDENSAYGFYSITSDFVQNTESPKTTAEATTTITVGTQDANAGLPIVLSLDAPFPNPTDDEAHLRYGLPTSGNVLIRVFDMIGREVSRVSQERQSGWHPLVLDTGALATGVYTVVLEAKSTVVSRRFTIVR